MTWCWIRRVCGWVISRISACSQYGCPMAAGWMAGALLSGRKTGIPAWVKRHGANGGRARLVHRGGKWQIVITNSAGYHTQQMEFVCDQLLSGAVRAKIRKRDAIVKKHLLNKAKRNMRG